MFQLQTTMIMCFVYAQTAALYKIYNKRCLLCIHLHWRLNVHTKTSYAEAGNNIKLEQIIIQRKGLRTEGTHKHQAATQNYIMWRCKNDIILKNFKKS
jgi:hypothetical protein